MEHQVVVPNPVARLRIDHQFEGFSGLLQVVDELHGVLEVHVVVHRPVDQQQLAGEVPGRLAHGALLVARRVFVRRAHVTLGVHRVVVAPVHDAAARDAGAETVGLGERGERHIAAEAPAVHSDPGGVHEIAGAEPVHRLDQIAEFLLAEVAVHRPGGLHPLAGGDPVVHHQDHDPLLGEVLEPHAARPGPGVADLGCVGASVYVDPGRVGARSIEAVRPHHHRFELCAVRGGDLQ